MKVKTLPSKAFLVKTSIAFACLLTAITDAGATKRFVRVNGTDAGPCTTGQTAAKTINYALSVAADEDTISIGAGTFNLTSTVIVNKKVLIDGTGKTSTFITGDGGVNYFFLFYASGATIRQVSIEKTDKTGGAAGQNLLGIQTNDISILNCAIKGQYVVGDGDVTRAIELSPNYTGFMMRNSEISNLRSPGYLNPGAEGDIRSTAVANTKGWLVDGADITFRQNTWSGNVSDIVLTETTPCNLYRNVANISSLNNNANIQDKRACGGTARKGEVLPAISSISCYPNPVMDVLTIVAGDLLQEGAQVTISDLTGRVLLSRNITEVQTPIDMGNFSQGIYIVNYQEGGNLRTWKVVKQ